MITKIIKYSLLLGLFILPLSAEAPKVAYVYNAKVLRVVDGDTLHVILDLGFDTWRKQTLRLLDVHAAEKRDKPNGPLHTKHLEKLLPVDTLCTIRTIKDRSDQYGRVLGEIWVKEVYVNAEMRDVIGVPQGTGAK